MPNGIIKERKPNAFLIGLLLLTALFLEPISLYTFSTTSLYLTSIGLSIETPPIFIFILIHLLKEFIPRYFTLLMSFLPVYFMNNITTNYHHFNHINTSPLVYGKIISLAISFATSQYFCTYSI